MSSEGSFSVGIGGRDRCDLEELKRLLMRGKGTGVGLSIGLDSLAWGSESDIGVWRTFAFISAPSGKIAPLYFSMNNCLTLPKKTRKLTKLR